MKGWGGLQAPTAASTRTAYFQKSMEIRKRLLEADPNNLIAIEDLMFSHESLGDPEQALALAYQLCGKQPGLSKYFKAPAKAAAKAGDSAQCYHHRVASLSSCRIRSTPWKSYHPSSRPTFARLADQVRAVESSGISMLHVDVMDGHFVPNITLGPPVVESLRKVTKLKLDCHLMITDPDKFAPAFVKAGADLISVHQEGLPAP